MDNRAEARSFLASRRARITPDQAGIEPVGTRRRVPGLRRDEVARLAGVSVDYYVRLERGNLTGVSDSVLDAIGLALHLDQAETDHLYDLAREANRSRRGRRSSVSTTRPLSPGVQYMLDAITKAPALVTNLRLDVVAANTLGRAMYADMFRTVSEPANHSRFIFLDPRARSFYADWDAAADFNVAVLRHQSGRFPHDRGLAELIGQLSQRSSEFPARWAAHNVRRHAWGVKRFHHRAVGPLDLIYQQVELDAESGHAMTVYPAVPGSPSEKALDELATWAVAEQITEWTAPALTGT
ncbi:MAG: helix-turn-helix transcriptional regulator [Actinomycetales bacterium]